MASATETALLADRAKYEKIKEEAQAQLDEANSELEAIQAYFDRKEGKVAPAPVPTASPVKRKGPAPGTPRAPRGSGNSAKDKVLALIREHGEMGIASKQIEEALPDTKSLANILSQLNKAQLIGNDGRGQPWFPKTPGTAAEAA